MRWSKWRVWSNTASACHKSQALGIWYSCTDDCTHETRRCRAHRHEVVEVVGVVEHRLRLPRNGQDGGHREHRVRPPQRLRTQQEGVRAVHYGIGHIRRLRPAGFTVWESIFIL